MSERENDGEFIQAEGPDVETSETVAQTDAAALHEQDQLRSVRAVEEGENR